MARVIALMALAALGLTEAPVHDPVHDHHGERLISTTERYSRAEWVDLEAQFPWWWAGASSCSGSRHDDDRAAGNINSII
jgi:hypothetical protein